jgi:S1-C subfamily serine protease
MSNILRVLLAAFACVALNATSFAGGPFGIIHVGKWQGAAYTTDKGAFSHCTGAAKFDKGLALILAENANRSWIIGVADPSWPFRDRPSVTLVLTYDGQAQFEVSGSAAREKVVIGNLPSQAVDALRKSHQLVVTASNRTLQFDLTEAGNVVAAIEYSVDKINTNGIAAAGDFSNPKVKPTTASTSAKPEEAPEASSDSGKLVSVSGSGFVVSRSAHIVTNNHVATDCVGDIHGNLVGQAPVKLRVVSADEENDLALLQGTKNSRRRTSRRSAAAR